MFVVSFSSKITFGRYYKFIKLQAKIMNAASLYSPLLGGPTNNQHGKDNDCFVSADTGHELSDRVVTKENTDFADGKASARQN